MCIFIYLFKQARICSYLLIESVYVCMCLFLCIYLFTNVNFFLLENNTSKIQVVTYFFSPKISVQAFFHLMGFILFCCID